MSDPECRVLMTGNIPSCIARMSTTARGQSRLCLDDIDHSGKWGPGEIDADFESVVSKLGEFHGVTDVQQPATRWGEFYPRMAWRGSRTSKLPTWGGVPYESYYFKYHASTMRGAHVSSLTLYERLSHVFRIVEPRTDNTSTYGHELRQLLILACTEVEAAWRGILAANGYIASRFSTNDYVKVLEPLRLAEWSVRLNAYPNLEAIAPFGDWQSSNPTSSLRWYDAYNAVKHDMEGQLHRATLKHVIEAMAAVAVMGWAQFGEQIIGIESVPHTALFIGEQRPQWSAQQVYFGPRQDNDAAWRATQYRYPQ